MTDQERGVILERLSGQDKQLDKIIKHLEGNGREGLLVRVDRLETAAKAAAEAATEAGKERRAAKGAARSAMWSVIVMIVMFIAKWLWESLNK